MAKKISGSKAFGQHPAAAERNSKSIEIMNKNVSKTFSMQNFGEKTEVDRVDGPVDLSAEVGSLERPRIGS